MQSFSSYFSYIGLNPLYLKGLSKEEMKARILSRYRKKESEIKAQTKGAVNLEFRPLIGILDEAEKFNEFTDWINQLTDNPNPELNMEKGGAVLSKQNEIILPKIFVGTQSFDAATILEAYKRYYKGESLEKINDWLTSLGITSWKIETERKEKEGAAIELPKITINEKGYLQDTNAEVSFRNENQYDDKARVYGSNPDKRGSVGSYTNVRLSNVLTAKEMEDVLGVVDTLAQYDAFGESASDEVKQKAKAIQGLRDAESEAVNIRYLLEIATQNYRMSESPAQTANAESKG